MKKVTRRDIGNYQFGSIGQNFSLIYDLNTFDEYLYEEIINTQNRLNELIEVDKIKNDTNVVYLIKGKGIEFNYIDRNNNVYEYRTIHNKPILINKEFDMFEIIEYSDFKEEKIPFIKKVCKVKKVNT